MKTGNIGIRNIADIGVADIDVYGADKNKYEAFKKIEEVKLRIGVFFDGTGNNRYNSDSVYYNKKYSNPPLEVDKIDQIKNLKSFVIESGSSYWNNYSNIALLHDLYEEKLDRDPDSNVFQKLQSKVYIQGIGTLQDEEDDMLGSGMGEGDRGVISRVEQACQQIADRIASTFDNIAEQKTMKIVSIQYDVFGFSRGAAAARHFCNEILKIGKDKNPGSGLNMPLSGLKRPNIKELKKTKETRPSIKQFKSEAYKVVKDNLRVVQQINAPEKDVFVGGKLGEYLKKNKIDYPKYNVSVEFLGLFDTVISQMLERKGILDAARNPITGIIATRLNPVIGMLTNSVSLIKKVNTNLSNPHIKKILQLKAETEWRDNFPITPIGSISNTTNAKELGVLGAHSDIGGAYWDTKEEHTILHFYDLGATADSAEKQKLEQQKDLLRKWYISQRLCDGNQIKWEIMHHIQAFKTYSNSSNAPLTVPQHLLMDKNFMGQNDVKVENNTIYTLVGYHHKLVSKRPLNNKLSLVYMNVMKYISSTYANVPFKLPESSTIHRGEYVYPEGDNQQKDLKKYYDLLKEVAEHGWINGEGKIVTYPQHFDEKGNYSLSWEMQNYIMGNFVHLSANFNAPLADALDHYNFAYANVPHFIDEKEFKNPPYKREYYTPILDASDVR